MSDQDIIDRLHHTRAGNAGKQMASAIIETIHLMYQNETALNYLAGLVKELAEEQIRRMEQEKNNAN